MSKEHLHARVSFKHLHAENFFLLNHRGQEKKKKYQPLYVYRQSCQTGLPTSWKQGTDTGQGVRNHPELGTESRLHPTSTASSRYFKSSPLSSRRAVGRRIKGCDIPEKPSGRNSTRGVLVLDIYLSFYIRIEWAGISPSLTTTTTTKSWKQSTYPSIGDGVQIDVPGCTWKLSGEGFIKTDVLAPSRSN